LIPRSAAEIINMTMDMTRARTLLGLTLLATCLALPGGTALAQQGGLLGNLFNGGSKRQAQVQQGQQLQPPAAVGTPGGNGVDARIDSIESALRQLTGQVQVLQHQMQMLQMKLNRVQGRGDTAPAPSYGTPGQRSQALPPAQNPQVPQNRSAGNVAPHGDAFNPALHPNAPGVPRTLGGGQRVEGGMGNQMGNGMNGTMGNNAPVGAPGGREPGAPLNLNALAGTQSAPQPAAPGGNGTTQSGTTQSGTMQTGTMQSGNRPAGNLPPPPPRNPSATGAKLATMPPNSSPKDVYELGYGYVLHKNYGLAAQTFQYFLQKYPKDHRAADAHYWLGESLFQEQHYDGAARSFLTVSTKYKHFSRAPNALLRLGQSLAALHHKEAACATLSEVKKKYPHASSSVKRAVARELKRVHC
jgi:tol-pal system protein YbgF